MSAIAVIRLILVILCPPLGLLFMYHFEMDAASRQIFDRKNNKPMWKVTLLNVLLTLLGYLPGFTHAFLLSSITGTRSIEESQGIFTQCVIL